MPIKDLSDTVRLPRLGKIHLGIRDPERGYPTKTEYFVLPKDHPDYAAIVKIFGDKPKELHVVIPVEDEEVWATQYYKAYTRTHGLVCKGDGDNAIRMVDVNTKTFPDKDTATMAMLDMTCAGKECSEYKAKKCQETMNLRFMLPEIPGLGVWQIDTGSINSILNINSCAKMIKNAYGRISMIPLKLTLEPTQVNNPEDGKKQMVYTMHLRTNVTMLQLAEAARTQAKGLMLEAPDLEDAFKVQVEKDIDELWPSDTAQSAKQATADAQRAKAEPAKQAATKTRREVPVRGPDTFKTLNDALRACRNDFGMQPEEVYRELGYKGKNDITEKPFEVYLKIKTLKACPIENQPQESQGNGLGNAGQFLSKVNEVFGLNKTQTMEYPDVKLLFDVGDFSKAYLKLAEIQAGKK